ncbi:unnamed protein product, partial [Ascophyllum nodosum]
MRARPHSDPMIDDWARINLPSREKLGVVVPVHSRDMARAVEKLRLWPAKCTQGIVDKSIDLVLYYTNNKAVPHDLEQTLQQAVEASYSCFRSAKMVSAQLNRELDPQAIPFVYQHWRNAAGNGTKKRNQ